MADDRRARRTHASLHESGRANDILVLFGLLGVGTLIFNFGRSSAPSTACCAQLDSTRLELATMQNRVLLAGNLQQPTAVGYLR